MNPLSALTSAYSLFQGIGQQRAARDQENHARRLEAENLRLARDQYDAANEQVRQLRAQGVGDPTRALADSEARYRAGLKMAQPEIARALRTAGARPGDSSYVDALNGDTVRRALAFRQDQERVIGNSLAQSQALFAQLTNAGQTYMNARSGAANRYRYDASTHPGNVEPAITALGAIDWDGMFRRRPGSPTKTGTPPISEAPMPTYDVPTPTVKIDNQPYWDRVHPYSTWDFTPRGWK